MKTYIIQVRGKVQGVGYRNFTNQVANQYDIKGKVRNIDDGSVEIIAQIDETDPLMQENFQKFQYALKSESPSEEIDSITVQETENNNIYNEFYIDS